MVDDVPQFNWWPTHRLTVNGEEIDVMLRPDGAAYTEEDMPSGPSWHRDSDGTWKHRSAEPPLEFEIREIRNLDRLRKALVTRGHVEIERHGGARSATSGYVSGLAELAAEANARGEHVARIRDQETGVRKLECNISREEACELLEMGAIWIGPPSMRPDLPR